MNGASGLDLLLPTYAEIPVGPYQSCPQDKFVPNAPQPCHVVGPNWRFILLEGTQYAISYDYSAITDDVFDIFRILKNLKEIVVKRTAKP